MQRLADDTGLAVEVHHLPPGTSKWNKIEHRLFSFITQNWRAKPLVSYKVIVDLIAATTTTTGLKVNCELDTNAYPKGLTVSDAEMNAINIHRRISRRMELHHSPNPSIRQGGCFLTNPKVSLTATLPHHQVHNKAGTIEGKPTGSDQAYYREMLAAIEPAMDWLFFGPAPLARIGNHIRTHEPQPAARIIAVEPADHPTDREIVAHARTFFKAAGRLLGGEISGS